MRRFNKNGIVFVLALVFFGLGLTGCFQPLSEQAQWLWQGLREHRPGSVSWFISQVDAITTERLAYHDLMMDVNSVRENLAGTRIVPKDDMTVVKADSGSLIAATEALDREAVDPAADRIATLRAVSEGYGARFLYCAAPVKGCFESAPANADNGAGTSFARYLEALAEREVPVLDLTGVLRETAGPEGAFFRTDHHWRPQSAFHAVRAVCEALRDRYGFESDEALLDLDRYQVTEYQDLFLGSYGKKVGRFFTWDGPDDFALILPDFPTELSVEQPAKEEVREGGFADTIIYSEFLQKDYYHRNPYAAYSGGDFRLQIVRNRLRPEGPKVLLVRDSFACAAAPFLALQCGELHVCDVRDYEDFVGDKLNLEQYIASLRPDYVLVLYSGVSDMEHSSGRYDFF